MYEWNLIDIGEVDKTRKAVPTPIFTSVTGLYFKYWIVLKATFFALIARAKTH